MSKCPFWSTKKQRVGCSKECPLFNKLSSDDENCIFCELSFDTTVDIKDTYDFMNLGLYKDEGKIKSTY